MKENLAVPHIGRSVSDSVMIKKIIYSDNAGTTILIRFMVGAVFLSEGIQKFLFTATLGSGRLKKIGLPNPELLGPFVGITEIICGILLLLGLLTRLSAIPIIIIMLTAIATTKAEVLSNEGFWEMLHASRTDWAMLLGAIYLLIRGGGKWSIDHSMTSKMKDKDLPKVKNE